MKPMIMGLASCLLVFFLFALPASAQLSRNGGKTQIGANELQVAERESRAVYLGEVDVVQGDARLRADKLTINFAGSATSINGGGFGDVENMLAEGNVFYITPSLRARGNTGLYDAATETIILTGDVIISRGEDVAKGERLVLKTATGESTLTGGTNSGGAEVPNSRVITILDPQNADPKE